jgi:hypothetical protein
MSPDRVKNFFSVSCRAVLGPSHSPIQWVPGTLSVRVKIDMNQTVHLQLVWMSRKQETAYLFLGEYFCDHLYEIHFIYGTAQVLLIMWFSNV